MGKLKNQMIIDQELAIVAAESWEHSVMANLRDYLAVHGVQDFKDALHSFDITTYRTLFNPGIQHAGQKCALTDKKE